MTGVSKTPLKLKSSITPNGEAQFLNENADNWVVDPNLVLSLTERLFKLVAVHDFISTYPRTDLFDSGIWVVNLVNVSKFSVPVIIILEERLFPN